MRTFTLGLVSSLALLVAPASLQPVHAAGEAGVTAAVNPDAAGTPPSLPTRVLDVGTNVLQDEHLTTGAQGQLQLLLRDGSTITMGPNGDLTVDKFVYDPDAGIAKLALTQSAGLIRIIGGRASKGDEGILVTTPTTTVGIRGGIGRVEVERQTGATIATLIYGKALTVNVDGTIRAVTRPGLTLSVLGKGQQPGPPTKVSTDQVMRANALLEGLPGRTGGTLTPVNDNVAAIRSANANAPSAESTFATVLSNPAFQAFTNLQVGSKVTQALIQNVLDNAAALGTLPACNICFNSSIGGGLPLTSASLLYTVAGGITDIFGKPYTGQGSYIVNLNGGAPITTAVPYISILGGGTSAIQAGIQNDANFGNGVINPASLVNTGGATKISLLQFLANPNASPGHPAQYASGAITAVTVNSAGVPTLIRNFAVNSVIDQSLNFQFPAGTYNGATIPTGTYTITNAFATAALTTMTFNGASLAERVGDSVMQAIRTTGGSGTVTTSGTYAQETSLTDQATGITYTETAPIATYVAKWNLSAAFALSPTQSLHFILGQPATNIPNSGIFTYNLIGATAPTFSDGSGRTGVFSAGTLSMNWAAFQVLGRNAGQFTVAARVLMPGEALYTLSLSGFTQGIVSGATTASISLGGSVTVTGASLVCPGSCGVTGSGVLGGPGANRIGFTYTIGNPSTFPSTFGVAGNAGNRIFGAAVFGR